MSDELLVDRWAALGETHQMLVDVEHDPWPRSTCWTRYTARCLCGTAFPTVAVTEAEQRNQSYINLYVDTLRQASHMKHLVQELLADG